MRNKRNYLDDCNDEYRAALECAANEFEARQRHTRHPIGHYEGGRRWWPDPDSERRVCCIGLREPSYAWPNSLRDHCRTLGHVAELFGVLAVDLQRHVKARAARKQSA